MSASEPPTVVEWWAIVEDCVENMAGVEWSEEEAVEVERADCIWELYESLPWSIQRSIEFRFVRRVQRADKIRLGFNPHRLIYWDNDLEMLSRVELHQELAEDERRAVRAQLEYNEVLPNEDRPEFVRVSDRGEFVLEMDEWFNGAGLFYKNLNLAIKYVRCVGGDEYAIYAESWSNDDPIKSRFVQLRHMVVLDCPECGEKDCRGGLVCKSCGLAIDPDPIPTAIDELEPDATLEDFEVFLSEWADEAIEGDYIDARSELDFLGSTEEIEVYENSGEYNQSGGTEFWVEKQGVGVVLFYPLNKEFRSDSDRSWSYSCKLCNSETRGVVDGARYKERVGFNATTVPVCSSCVDLISGHLKQVIKESGRAPEYVSKMV